jgi:small subunit ribosomal protein S16
MLIIRLQRLGKKKQPTYRLIVSEKHKDTQAGSLEILGHYNPTVNPKIKEFKTERIKYWLQKGAQLSDTVHNLLLEAGIVEGKKRKSVYLSNKRRAKIAEKVKVAEEKKKVAEEKKKKEEEEVKTNAEAEVETPIENSAEEKTE